MTAHFWYLATPYSRYEAGLERAHEDACIQAALLIRAGVAVFCPIAHSHPIAKVGGIDPLDHAIWLPVDEPMMAAAFGLIVCKLQGWSESIGVAHEIERFKRDGKSIVMMEPGIVPLREVRVSEWAAEVAARGTL